MDACPKELWIVDDCALTRKVVQVHGHRGGFACRTFGDPESMMNALGTGPWFEGRPGVILVDSEMPGTCGTEVVGRIRQSGFAGLVYMHTATIFPELVRRAVASGANGVIAKSQWGEKFASLRSAMRGLAAG